MRLRYTITTHLEDRGLTTPAADGGAPVKGSAPPLVFRWRLPGRAAALAPAGLTGARASRAASRAP
jgi:hypothetical protein